MFSLIVSDLVRSKKRIKPIFFSNLILTALTTILSNLYSYFSNLKQALYSDTTSTIFNYTIIVGFFNFLIFIIILLIILTILVNGIFTLYYIEKRSRDIAVMKANGISYPVLYRFFSFPPAIATLTSFFLGFCIVDLVMNIIWPGLFAGFPFSIIFILILLFGNIAVVIFVPPYKLEALFKKNVASLLNQDYNKYFFELRKKSWFRNLLSKFGKTVLYSYKNLLTRKKDFARSMTILTCTCIVTGLLFTSGSVIQLTYRSNVTNALGGESWPDIVIMGQRDIVNFVTASYEAFSQPGIKPAYNSSMYSTAFNMNKKSFNLTMFSDEILNVDWRIIYNTTAGEVPEPEILGSNQYQMIGSNRKCSTLVQGVNLTTMFNKFPEISPNSFQNESVILGDSIAGLIFDNIQIEHVSIDNNPFPISGSVFDPLENGFTIYMNIDQMRSILNKTSEYYNCAFITLKPMTDSERTKLVSELDAIAKQTYGANFVVQSMKDVFSGVTDSLNSLTWIQLLLGILIFIFIILFQNEFVKIAIYSNFKDYSIMHAMGISKHKIGAMLQEEFFLTLCPSAILAFSLSLLFNEFFLIKMPVLPSIFVPVGIFIAISFALIVINRILVHIELKFT